MTGMSTPPTDLPARVPVRLGQLLQLSGIADTGAEARALVTGGDVLVDGAREDRRGRQLSGGEIVEVRTGSGVEVVRVVADPVS